MDEKRIAGQLDSEHPADFTPLLGADEVRVQVEMNALGVFFVGAESIVTVTAIAEIRDEVRDEEAPADSAAPTDDAVDSFVHSTCLQSHVAQFCDGQFAGA